MKAMNTLYEMKFQNLFVCIPTMNKQNLLSHVKEILLPSSINMGIGTWLFDIH